MRRLLCMAACVFSALAAFQPHLAAQKQQQVFLKLLDPSGAPVADLQASEVTVSEDGVACKTLKVEPVDWPMKLQVLVDNGPTTTGQMNSLRDGLRAFFDQIPEGVEMSMVTTAPNSRMVVKPTTDKQKLVDGIGLIAPDRGAGAFLEALVEATGRIDKDKAPHFPVIFMIGSDFGRSGLLDRDFQKLQDTIIKRAATVHVAMVTSAVGGTTKEGAQVEVGLGVTKLSGGRYENINATTRLATLLPEWGKKIAESHARQSHQYRVTYERPPNAKEQASIGATVRHEGTAQLSLDGHLP